MKKRLLLLLFAGALILGGCNTNTSTQKGEEETTTTERIEIEKVDVTLDDSKSGIFVTPVEGITDDFIIGCDVSSLISEEKSGVKYYNNQGEEQDLLLTLAENGVNTIRIRVWNDPYDENGKGYGGGNNDVDTAIAIGQRATKYGMKSMIDFHYSDFWADPAKQMVPKAWAEITLEEKEQAVYDYTYESMKKIFDAGIEVNIVQVGNETTTGMCGETKWDAIATLMNAGSRAIRELATEYNQDVMIAVHFTNPENTSNYEKFGKMMNEHNVDYDIFASSYYPVWHGTLENLTTVLSDIAEKYDKKVMVAEFSYAYTYENGDTFANSISEETNCAWPYSVSVQGQANCIRDIAAAVTAVGEAGIGICYWEPAWLPVPGDSYEEQFVLWEENGSGWASSYSSKYDPNDAGKYYGGCSWDNQALFDFEGHPLASLSAFRFLKSGATTDVALDYITPSDVVFRLKEDVILPETVDAVMNDGSIVSIPVTWSQTEFDNSKVTTYTLTGTATYEGKEYPATGILNIKDLNYVENSDFEGEDTSMWIITDVNSATDECYIIDKQSDAVSGTHSFHFYSATTEGVDCTIEQTITGLKPGTYKFYLTLHGGGCTSQDISIHAIADGVTYTSPATITDWQELSTPIIAEITTTDGTITVGAHVITSTGGWGNLDDFVLAPVE